MKQKMNKLDDLKMHKLSESNLSKSVGKKAAPPPSPQPSCESMSDEELSFSFNGQSYPSYQEMVDAKRLRNAKVLEKSGLLNAKQAVVDAMVAVSSRGKKDNNQIKLVHGLKRARDDNNDNVGDPEIGPSSSLSLPQCCINAPSRDDRSHLRYCYCRHWQQQSEGHTWRTNANE